MWRKAARFLAVAPLIAVITALLILHLRGYRLLGVQTASMVPVFGPGDAIIVRPVAARDLRPGNIISYHSPLNPNLVISHLLARIDHHTGWLTTSGDALKTTDPAFPPRLLIGQAIAVAPNLGLLLNKLRQPLDLVLAVYLPAVVTIVTEARHLMLIYTQPFYSVRL